MPALRRRRPEAEVLPRAQVPAQFHQRRSALTASAAEVKLSERGEAGRIARLKQPWQEEAWLYRRALGELRYATEYLGNACMRLRLHPATRVPGVSEPVELRSDEAAGLPRDLVLAAIDVLAELAGASGNDTAALVKKLTENFQVTGEGFLVGEDNRKSDVREWSLYSVSEIVADGSRIGVRESPSGGIGDNNTRWLSYETSVVTRMWCPDPEWSLLPDSPFRAVLDICEELLLLGRDVRATARSRLANNGILLVPDGLSIVRSGPIGDDDDGDDDDVDPFVEQMMDVAATSLQNEGEASAILPIVTRGPAEALQQVRHLVLDRPQNQFNITQRAELISRIATGIDLPAEVLTGKATVNHWGMYQIDDDTFRHHVEPMARVEVQALTAGYLWMRLDAMRRWPPEVVRRVFVWFDPTGLVVHPDRMADAKDAWDRNALSGQALRKYGGFPEDDAPSDEEIVVRTVLHGRTVDPAVQAAVVRKLDPTLDFPDPAEHDHGATPDDGPGTSAPQPGDSPNEGSPNAGPPSPSAATEARVMQNRSAQMRASAMRALVASAASDTGVSALGPRLVRIDHDLRARLVVACDAAVRRSLERMGARVITKSRNAASESQRQTFQSVHKADVAFVAGRAALAEYGVDATADDFADVHEQWDAWVEAAGVAALTAVAAVIGAEIRDAARDELARLRAEGWVRLEAALLAAVDRAVSADQRGESPSLRSYVTPGVIRAALAIAGGFGLDPTSSGVNDEGQPVDLDEVYLQVATGAVVAEEAARGGVVALGYQWVHGDSKAPFAPHLRLDGQVFRSLNDEALAVGAATFPSTGGYYPGDHSGCSCDAMPVLTIA